jgi:phage tail-like protein
MIRGLPGMYQEDPFARDLTAAFDEILAPVVSSLDNLPAYLDPALAPEDFLEWLAGWVAALVDESWPLEQRRRFVAQAASLHRRRGTLGGLREHLRIFTDGEVQVEESGSAAWSPTPGTTPPPARPPHVHVRVIVDQGAAVDPVKLDALVAAAKPAHLSHSVEVVPVRPAGSPPSDPAGGTR